MSVIKGKCGTDCNSCQFKDKFNCSGCVEQEGKIFWGECDIYKCAATRGFRHCGECKELPCRDLTTFIENGHNPDRLSNLKRWKDEEKKTITIKPLTAELNADYLDFFDNRAFTDNNPNGPCYCTSPNQTEEDIRQMVSEFKTYGVKETVRKYAVDMLNKNKIHGYLAYDGELSIGWCNAADKESYVGFVPAFARANTCGKTISIVCFEIAPEYRGQGMASAFIDRVCSDAKTNGYIAVEGYAEISEKPNDFDYHGPMRLYQKVGFVEVARENGQIVMRKML